MGETGIKERNTLLFRCLSLLAVALLACCFFDSSKPADQQTTKQKITATSVRHHGLPVKTTAFKVKTPLLNLLTRQYGFAVTQKAGLFRAGSPAQQQTPVLFWHASITHHYDTGDEEPPFPETQFF